MNPALARSVLNKQRSSAVIKSNYKLSGVLTRQMTERTLEHVNDIHIRMEEAEECANQYTCSKIVDSGFSSVEQQCNLEIASGEIISKLLQMRKLTEDTEWLAA